MDIKVKSHLKPCAAVSIAIMIVALVMTLTGHGMNLGVDFTGGTYFFTTSLPQPCYNGRQTLCGSFCDNGRRKDRGIRQ